MINVFPFAGFPVAVLGLGKSGFATAKALLESEAEVWAWDDSEAARERAEDAGIPLVDLMKADLRETTTLVLSPGIPLHHPEPHPVVVKAREAGLEIIGDIELLVRAQRDAGYIGITGTNGKSTTTTLIGHIVEMSGREVEVGGNIGRPVLELQPLGVEATYVLEMSSYQLELVPSLTFDVAVWLNISTDHIERHGSLEGYIQAKKTIFQRQTKPRTAVIGIDDDHSYAVYQELKAKGDQNLVPVAVTKPAVGGVYVQGGVLYDDTEGQALAVLDLNNIPSLPGEHNHQNAAAAYAACKATGISPHIITAAMQSYPGLVHRQEAVDVVDGVLFVNDSKATNVDAAKRALGCYDAIYWIAGGQPKSGGLAGIDDDLLRVHKAFLIGDAANDFAAYLDGKVETEVCGTLDKAVAAAFAAAKADGEPGACVLLSPACASWDQFENFEDRGDTFKALVEALPGDHKDPFEELFGGGA